MNIPIGRVRKPSPDVTDGVYYPSSDGKPLAETPRHFVIIAMVRTLLEQWFAQEANVCIGADMFVYYEEGNPRRHVTPDIMFVRGAPPSGLVRRRYLTWREPRQTLDFVLEVTSRSTQREDRVVKHQIYQDALQVQEYFQFDPYMDWLNPAIQGFRLHNGVYQPIEWVESRLPSEVLGLHLEHDGELLRFYNPTTQEWLPTPDEALEQHLEAREQAEREREQIEKAFQQAERERQQAERERQQAERDRKREARARKKAEQEVERLRQELDRLRGQQPDSSAE